MGFTRAWRFEIDLGRSAFSSMAGAGFKELIKTRPLEKALTLNSALICFDYLVESTVVLARSRANDCAHDQQRNLSLNG
jgi:hypothetical protein